MVDDMISSAHPLLPPTQEEDQLAWLRLLQSRRVGIATFYRLMAEIWRRTNLFGPPAQNSKSRRRR